MDSFMNSNNELFITDILPCCNGNEYYKGRYNIFNNKDKGKKCSDCEYIQAIEFIMSELNDYELNKCCDLEDSSKKNPDMLFTNKFDDRDNVVMELKRIKNINSNNINYSDIITARKKNIEKFSTDIYSMIGLKYKELNIDIDKFFDIIINSITVGIYNSVREIRYNPIYNKIGLYYKGSRTKKRDEFIKSISKEILDFILSNAKIVSDNKKILKEYEFQVEDIGFFISLNNQEGFQVTYTYRDEISSGMYFPREHIKLKINEFYNECREKFINYHDHKKVLLIRNETHFDRDNIIDAINKIDRPDIIDEIWIEFIEYIDDLEEVAIGKKYMKLN
ncbi:hypothetical protein [Paraclostridium tenue]|uniref:Uncharacterized protein n=1 Tax=Paraclostridium tenue TaxID=1737 RepID=A0ABN1M6R7_9FIRM